MHTYSHTRLRLQATQEEATLQLNSAKQELDFTKSGEDAESLVAALQDAAAAYRALHRKANGAGVRVPRSAAIVSNTTSVWSKDDLIGAQDWMTFESKGWALVEDLPELPEGFDRAYYLAQEPGDPPAEVVPVSAPPPALVSVLPVWHCVAMLAGTDCVVAFSAYPIHKEQVTRTSHSEQSVPGWFRVQRLADAWASCLQPRVLLHILSQYRRRAACARAVMSDDPFIEPEEEDGNAEEPPPPPPARSATASPSKASASTAAAAPAAELPAVAAESVTAMEEDAAGEQADGAVESAGPGEAAAASEAQAEAVPGSAAAMATDDLAGLDDLQADGGQAQKRDATAMQQGAEGVSAANKVAQAAAPGGTSLPAAVTPRVGAAAGTPSGSAKVPLDADMFTGMESAPQAAPTMPQTNISASSNAAETTPSVLAQQGSVLSVGGDTPATGMVAHQPTGSATLPANARLTNTSGTLAPEQPAAPRPSMASDHGGAGGGGEVPGAHALRPTLASDYALPTVSEGGGELAAAGVAAGDVPRASAANPFDDALMVQQGEGGPAMAAQPMPARTADGGAVAGQPVGPTHVLGGAENLPADGQVVHDSPDVYGGRADEW